MKRGSPKRVQVKSVAVRAEPQDGMRVLVERRWPRGAYRQGAAIDLWLRDAAPSPALSLWYRRYPRRWKRFRHCYWAELARRPRIVHLLEDLRRRTPVTLLFGAQDDSRNHAELLREFIDRKGDLP
ncbi:MAG: DUF488 domain-containing protein [Burkholderiales bacterium]